MKEKLCYMDKCPNCNTYWVHCPCCGEFFCPDCGMSEQEAEEQDEE